MGSLSPKIYQATARVGARVGHGTMESKMDKKLEKMDAEQGIEPRKKRASTRGEWSTKKKTPGPRRSTNGGPGPRNVDMRNWRRQMQVSRMKLDDDAKQRFLDSFREYGLFTRASEYAGVRNNTIRHHMELDPDFAAAVQEAKEFYRDKVISHHRDLLFNGCEEPIVGGKDKDEIVAYKRVYPIRLIELELRRQEPEYREKTEMDMNVNGGVLVAPAAMSAAEWAEKYGKGEADGGTTDPS